jgi:hypothetical protein
MKRMSGIAALFVALAACAGAPRAPAATSPSAPLATAPSAPPRDFWFAMHAADGMLVGINELSPTPK